MTARYTKVNNSFEAKVHDGYLYVRSTGMNYQGMLVQGDRIGDIYRMPYSGTLEQAIAQPRDDGEYMNAVDRCAMGGKGELVKQGRLIR
jgi:hypothetical protein